MATTYKGRSGARSRSTYGSYSGLSFGSGLGGWGGMGGNDNRKSNSRKSHRSTGGGNTGASAYRCCCNTFEKKIDSYRTLCDQTRGPASAGRPSPTTLNSFANWINKGAVVQTVSKAQVSRWARTTNKSFNPHNPSPTACKNVLTAKFGRSAIKAVAKTKTGSFMVATTPTINGRSFCFPR